MLSEMKFFDGYVCVELFSQLDNFISYLPHPCSNIVFLLSAQAFKFEGCLAGALIPVALEFCSAFFEAELSRGNVLSKVCLFQNFLFAYYGYGDFGAVHVYAHPVLSSRRLWKVFGYDYKEFEVLFHDDAGHLPAFFEVFLETLICSILFYWEACSSAVESDAEDRVSTLGPFKTKEPSVESDNTFLYLFLDGLPYAPCVACSLYDKLGRRIILASEHMIGFFVKLSPRLHVADVVEGILNHAEEGSIRLPKQFLLSLRRLKKVQRQTLPRKYPKIYKRYLFKRIVLQFLHN